MPTPSPRSLRTARATPAVARAAVLALALWSFAFAVSAAPAPWYYWRSKVDGARVCAQTSPGPGWERDSAAYDGPGCQPRRKVLVVPMR
ncbi:MAG: hypothetical protein ACK41V_03000 [Acidovorax sp.]|uniref:hypothetical protein n=1 Tax=Acidovorax sp. TaxID=1872122 RepID=UPI00391DD399